MLPLWISQRLGDVRNVRQVGAERAGAIGQPVRSGAALRRSARIDEARREVLAERERRFGQRRRTHRAAVIGPEADVADRGPFDIAVISPDRAGTAIIVGDPRRAAHGEQLEEGPMREQRDPDFGIGFLHLERSRAEGRQGVVEGKALLDERIGLVEQFLPPIFGADREPDRAARQVEPLARIARHEGAEDELVEMRVRDGVANDILARRLVVRPAANRIVGDAGGDIAGELGRIADDVDLRGRIELGAALDLAGGRIAAGVHREEQTRDIDVAEDRRCPHGPGRNWPRFRRSSRR